MSDNHNQSDLRTPSAGTPASSDLPPFERIMQERAAAEAAKKAQAADAPDQWATRPMTLAEKAAQRAEEREAAARAKADAAAAAKAEKAASEVAAAQEEASEDVAEEAAAVQDAPRQEAVPQAERPAPQRTRTTTAPAQKRPAGTAAASSQKPPAKRRRRARRQFPWMACILLICIAVIAVAAVHFTRNWVVPPNASDTSVVEVEIPEGATVSDMGAQLEEQGLIRSAGSFSLYVRLTGTAQNLQAGVHRLSPSMTLGEVVSSLQEGAAEAGLDKVTVNEGLTVDQIGDVIAESTSYSKEDFMALMTDDAFLQQLVSEYPILTDAYNTPNVRYVLEGYLFPATYDFNDEDGLESLVRQMVSKTDEVLAKYQADIDASSYNVQQLMSIASLVEKEGMTTEDRKLIAGVFYNRLEQGMAIQSDISVLYALNTHKEMVSYEDLEVDSPYNLYLNTGLPPGPMNSPSEDAIVAALEPTDSDYIYFYANLKTGEVFYTADYEQHLAWQEEYEETGDIQG